MSDNRTTVFGIYSNRIQTEGVVNALMQAGFSGADISLLLPEDELAAHTTMSPRRWHARVSDGAPTGLAEAGAIELLAGLGSLDVPGLGPLIAAGPLVATLAGHGDGRTVGGLLGTLVAMGVSEYDARRYEGRVRRGAILLAVTCESAEEARRANAVLEHTGAEDIAAATETGAMVTS